nr:pyruvate ferredoxin oxidoreductase [Patescibacteria group bacterium]
HSLLDSKNPKTFGPVALQNSYFEFRKQIFDAMNDVKKDFSKIATDFSKISGNKKYGAVEVYKTKGASKIIIAMGSVCGTIKSVIDELEKKGEKVGLAKIRLFRPFPYKEVKKALKSAKEIIVFDRNLVFGSHQVLAGEITEALGNNRKIRSVIFGLGGRDVFESDIEKVLKIKDKQYFLK